ncbi:hypothetical protein IKE86_01995 [Candidatus Saccharibacteria bacterium]|nr:hypothetical protein [Candidatus Saccharibacteria bacterium]
MQKSKKNILGLLGLAFVAAMTVFAYFLPANGAYAEGASDSHTDVIRVTVYDQYPALKIDDPETDYVSTSPELTVKFTYENSQYVDFTLTYTELDADGNVVVDGEGNPVIVTVPLPRFNPDPSRLDPTFNYDSDSNEVTINLADYNLGYGHYTLTASADSPIGKPADDYIEFDYVPTKLVQTGSADTTNDPIADVIYGDNVSIIELMPVDKNGNPILEKPIVVKVEPDENGNFNAGSQSVTFPFTSYGLETGDYDVVVTAYSGTPTVIPGEIDPETGEQGEDTYVYDHLIPSPRVIYTLSYVQPAAPDIPNTGRFLGSLNLAASDVVITSIIAFAGVTAVAFILVGRKKKDYRKNIRSRK